MIYNKEGLKTMNDTAQEQTTDESLNDFDWGQDISNDDVPESQDENLDASVTDEAPAVSEPDENTSEVTANENTSAVTEGDVTVTEQAPIETPPATQSVEETQTSKQTQQPLEEKLITHIQNAIPELEKTYVFTQEEADQLQTEPELVLPKLAAKMHANIVSAVLRNLPKIVPHYVEQQTTQATRERDSWDNFYAINSDLKGKVTKQQVLQIAQMYRTMNPNVTGKDAIIGIGKAIRMASGMAEPAAASTSNTVATSTPVKPTPASNAQPFIPAQGRGAGGSKPANSVWDEMADDDDLF